MPLIEELTDQEREVAAAAAERFPPGHGREYLVHPDGTVLAPSQYEAAVLLEEDPSLAAYG